MILNKNLGITEPKGKRPKKGPSLDLGIINTVYSYYGQFYYLIKYFYTFPKLTLNNFKKKSISGVGLKRYYKI